MAVGLLVEGDWPGLLTLSRGWFRAEARPWNDDDGAAQLRLVRGTSDFLAAVSSQLVAMTGATIYSPAVFPPTGRIWRRAGFETAHQLVVMERSMSAPWSDPTRPVVVEDEPDWDQVLEVDRAAFEGFWRMSKDGLLEAYNAASRHAILAARADDALIGFAILGSQWASAYLQRIAVLPAWSGRGVGTSLVRAGLGWSHAERARSIVLNVRPDGDAAHRLYRKEGFTDTGSRLEVLACNG